MTARVLFAFLVLAFFVGCTAHRPIGLDEPPEPLKIPKVLSTIPAECWEDINEHEGGKRHFSVNYARGMKASERGSARVAVGLFVDAIGQRPASRAELRVDGGSFMEYLPYLRLSQALYRAGRAECACRVIELEDPKEVQKSGDDRSKSSYEDLLARCELHAQHGWPKQ